MKSFLVVIKQNKIGKKVKNNQCSLIIMFNKFRKIMGKKTCPECGGTKFGFISSNKLCNKCKEKGNTFL